MKIEAKDLMPGDWIGHRGPKHNERVVRVVRTQDGMLKVYTDYGNGGEPAMALYGPTEELKILRKPLETENVNRIPFNLEAFKAGQLAVDTDGSEHKFVAYVTEARPAFRVVTINLNTGGVHALSAQGYDCLGEPFLYMKPKIRKVHYALYRDKMGYVFTTGIFESKESMEHELSQVAYEVLAMHCTEVLDEK